MVARPGAVGAAFPMGAVPMTPGMPMAAPVMGAPNNMPRMQFPMMPMIIPFRFFGPGFPNQPASPVRCEAKKGYKCKRCGQPKLGHQCTKPMTQDEKQELEEAKRQAREGAAKEDFDGQLYSRSIHTQCDLSITAKKTIVYQDKKTIVSAPAPAGPAKTATTSVGSMHPLL